MSVLVMVLTGLGVVKPRLSDPQIDVVLWIGRGLEVFGHTVFNPAAQRSHHRITQHEVIDTRGIGHVRSCVLAIDKSKLFL